MNRLADSGVNRLGDTSAFVNTAGQLLLTRRGKTRMDGVGIVFEFYIKKGMVLYSAVSSPLDRSKRFTLSSPGRPVHSDTVLGFSWKHSSHAAIAPG